MPKRRKDLITAWYWIERRIKKHGKPEVLQLVPQKCYYVVTADRPRLPPLREEGYKGPNNLMPIPAGSVLYKRYMVLGEKHYLRRFLDDPKMAVNIGFVEKGTQILIPIFEVVDGLAFSQRKSDHMLAGYNLELQSLRNTVTEGRQTLSDQAFRVSSLAEKREVQLAVYRAETRIAEIELIVADHIQRQVTLNFAFERACSRLNEMAVILERVAYHIRTRSVRIGAIQTVTNNILSELPYFNSKEVRDLTKSVSIALGALGARTDKNLMATFVLSERLTQAAKMLFDASNRLREEAEKVPDEEKIAAREMTDV